MTSTSTSRSRSTTCISRRRTRCKGLQAYCLPAPMIVGTLRPRLVRPRPLPVALRILLVCVAVRVAVAVAVAVAVVHIRNFAVPRPSAVCAVAVVAITTMPGRGLHPTSVVHRPCGRARRLLPLLHLR